MEEIFTIAEQEMIDLKHPYVGTEHFLLAFLKIYGSEYINYKELKEYIIKVVGSSYKTSEYILYTPILRSIKNECENIYDAMIRVITDDNSIAYNILLSMGIDIEAFYLSIINSLY